MPTFDTNPLENLQFAPGDADHDIDLTKMSHDQALAHVADLLEKGTTGQSYCLHFSPPKGDGAETLFQPLGRFLLAARKKGKISRCLPVSEGTAYFIVFPAS